MSRDLPAKVWKGFLAENWSAARRGDPLVQRFTTWVEAIAYATATGCDSCDRPEFLRYSPDHSAHFCRPCFIRESVEQRKAKREAAS